MRGQRPRLRFRAARPTRFLFRRRRRRQGRRYPHPSCAGTDARPARLRANELRRQIRKAECRVCARIEATELGLDIRYVITNITNGSPEHIYDTLYCARGQMENLIKLHKSQLASDRTSVGRHCANGRCDLFCITAAHWRMLELRDAILSKTHPLVSPNL